MAEAETGGGASGGDEWAVEGGGERPAGRG
jgi:hypothetical protein